MPEELTKNAFAIVDTEILKQFIFEAVKEAVVQYFEKPKEDKLLTIAQVTDLLDADRSTLWHWNKEGYLKKIYIGGKPRYKESDVRAILEGRPRNKNTKTP